MKEQFNSPEPQTLALHYDYFNEETPVLADSLLTRLNLDAAGKMHPDDSESDLTWGFYAEQVSDDLIAGSNYEEASAFIDKVFANKKLAEYFVKNPAALLDFTDIKINENDVFDSQEHIDVYIENSTQRRKAYEFQDAQLAEIEKSEQKPTEEELAAGVFKKELEVQVADAVFTLRRKGYNSFESGYTYQVCMGIQSIGFSKEIALPKNAPEELIEELKKQNMEIYLEEHDDRYSIFLKPEKRTATLIEWKKAWDTVADMMPSLETDILPNTFTPIARRFREEASE